MESHPFLRTPKRMSASRRETLSNRITLREANASRIHDSFSYLSGNRLLSKLSF
jgi:hypothetical protein